MTWRGAALSRGNSIGWQQAAPANNPSQWIAGVSGRRRPSGNSERTYAALGRFREPLAATK